MDVCSFIVCGIGDDCRSVASIVKIADAYRIYWTYAAEAAGAPVGQRFATQAVAELAALDFARRVMMPRFGWARIA